MSGPYEKNHQLVAPGVKYKAMNDTDPIIKSDFDRLVAEALATVKNKPVQIVDLPFGFDLPSIDAGDTGTIFKRVLEATGTTTLPIITEELLGVEISFLNAYGTGATGAWSVFPNPANAIVGNINTSTTDVILGGTNGGAVTNTRSAPGYPVLTLVAISLTQWLVKSSTAVWGN